MSTVYDIVRKEAFNDWLNERELERELPPSRWEYDEEASPRKRLAPPPAEKKPA